MIIDKLAWLELKEGKILSTRSSGKDTYYIPGGKREAGETDQQALIREIQEELSITLIESTIAYVDTFQTQAHGHPEGVEVKMQCYRAAYKGSIKAASEIEEVVWLSYGDREHVSPVDKIIFDWLKAEGLLK
ncbi:NUDIX hydrolase [Pontibacter akesuensis]|uniref:8-oxo-dGTP pyrophosphatase MutT, NUDIX family n=1 Tax=Pontibacter akesuensis TaxID=388950 RepID=A0A1I7J655_9BACT|nr:NUDIX domain-containing protein [Pontibacter akesuensis]GHA72151.1 DNA mismatch repair protein MutT [Pontibacter akesuensis]SFU80699.1 8-oxo-dGTP pyrophosphatase MutT, NUDIX family [Pontibacter akesuensis]